MNGRPILEPSRARLHTYTGAAIPTHGRIRVPVRLPSDTTEPTLLPLVIVDGEGPTLLGRDWLHAVRLDWTNIHNLQTPGRDANPKQPRLQALLNEYDDLLTWNLHRCQSSHRAARRRPASFLQGKTSALRLSRQRLRRAATFGTREGHRARAALGLCSARRTRRQR